MHEAQKTRVYVVDVDVTEPPTHITRLVRAANVRQAERHVSRDYISGRLASQDDLIQYLSVEDLTIEEAGADVAAAEDTQE